MVSRCENILLMRSVRIAGTGDVLSVATHAEVTYLPG